MSDDEYMKIAYQEALKAYEKDEVPIGAVIVYQDKIIAKAHNQREKNQQVTSHAEILAIQQASDYLKSWRLDECTLYTTLEPCLMCSGAIIQSHIKRVVYATSSDKWLSLNKIITIHNKQINHIPYLKENVLFDKCSQLLKQYFQNKRQRY